MSGRELGWLLLGVHATVFVFSLWCGLLVSTVIKPVAALFVYRVLVKQ